MDSNYLLYNYTDSLSNQLFDCAWYLTVRKCKTFLPDGFINCSTDSLAEQLFDCVVQSGFSQDTVIVSDCE